jgi:capsular exopolysaccharide synthesis family protein
MKEPSELAKAFDVILRNSALEQTNGSQGGHATPPIVGYGEDASYEGAAHLRDYWLIIRKRLWLIIGIAAIIGALSMIREARLPDSYQARARVQVDVEGYSPALGASRGSTVLIDNSYMDPEYFNTQVQILSSPTLLRRVAKTLDLEHKRNFLEAATENRSTGQNLLRMFGFAGKKNKTPAKPSIASGAGEQLALMNNAASGDADEVDRLAPHVASLLGMIDVAPVKKTRLIDIRCTHSDPQVATKVCNATADAFWLWNLEAKTKTNTIAGTYLQKRIAELQSQIRSGEEQLVNYAQSHQILSLDANQNTVVERLAGLNRQLLEVENDRELAAAAYRTSLAPGAAAAAAETSDKQIADFKSRLSELKQKRAQLLLTDTEESPEVKDITEQITTLENHLSATRVLAISLATTNLETNYRKTLDREKALREAFNKQRAETVTQNQSAINYNILKQEIATNKNLLDGLMQRAKENDVTMAGTPNNIHVVDYASVPGGPVGPRRLQGVLVALVVAIAFGVALSLFLEYLNDTVNSAGDVENQLRLPAVALIPLAGKAVGQRFLPLPKVLQKGNGYAQPPPELLLDSGTPSLQAEAYRHLRTSVLLSTPGRAPKTLLVTSSVPAEGKTTTVVNVATVLAQTGARVLVIDADMRRPRLHMLFGMENRQGLSAILSSEISDAGIFALINQYRDTNIYLLTSGAIPPNPAELVGSEQMLRLLRLTAPEFKYTVIDSPPIASFTDGVLISSLVDGVLLVVHAGKTSRQVVRRTRQMLQEIGAKVIGVVLNKIDMHSQDYHYQQHYKRYYQHAEGNGDQSSAIGPTEKAANR